MASDCSGDTCHEVAFGQTHERYGALLALLEEAQRGDYCVSCVAGFHLTQRDFQEQQTLSFKQLGFCDFCSLQHFGFTRSIKMMDGPFSSNSFALKNHRLTLWISSRHPPVVPWDFLILRAEKINHAIASFPPFFLLSSLPASFGFFTIDGLPIPFLR